ncbi:MAG: hypothetical protein JM57_11100 [Comamonadaceae bacterium BICA1-1]|nr:MAG: hypothetical protein JM57_11100 [Comamonadaceae bacterium BICA1-1]
MAASDRLPDWAGCSSKAWAASAPRPPEPEPSPRAPASARAPALSAARPSVASDASAKSVVSALAGAPVAPASGLRAKAAAGCGLRPARPAHPMGLDASSVAGLGAAVWVGWARALETVETQGAVVPGCAVARAA